VASCFRPVIPFPIIRGTDISGIVEELAHDVQGFSVGDAVSVWSAFQASATDGVIHAAFNHDFSNLKQHSEEDRKVIETLGEALAGSDRPLVISSGSLARSKAGGPSMETDDHVTSAEFPRAASEEAADALIAKGGRVMVMRNPRVHDTRRFGRVTKHIQLARRWGRVAYVGEGKNRSPAVHVSDAVRLYRLVLEKGVGGRATTR
jgi:nucleoside-diphosphate-sugar epimerase